jgi:hypothetical protein
LYIQFVVVVVVVVVVEIIMNSFFFSITVISSRLADNKGQLKFDPDNVISRTDMPFDVLFAFLQWNCIDSIIETNRKATHGVDESELAMNLLSQSDASTAAYPTSAWATSQLTDGSWQSVEDTRGVGYHQGNRDTGAMQLHDDEEDGDDDDSDVVIIRSGTSQSRTQTTHSSFTSNTTRKSGENERKIIKEREKVAPEPDAMDQIYEALKSYGDVDIILNR